MCVNKNKPSLEEKIYHLQPMFPTKKIYLQLVFSCKIHNLVAQIGYKQKKFF
jgi:hypothetical protein